LIPPATRTVRILYYVDMILNQDYFPNKLVSETTRNIHRI
jgi:hypothetical protein